MIRNLENFNESIAFELYTLETICPAIDRNGDMSIDLRGSTGEASINTSFHENISEQAVNALKDQLSPLLFGSAWKILDLLLEFSLNTADLAPRGRVWAINEKKNLALNGQGNSAVLACSSAVWRALLRLYAGTVEHRHCLVHRTAKVDSTTGTMDGVDQDQNPLRSLMRNQQIALAKAATLAARGVLEEGIEKRAEDHLKHQLDQLVEHTGVPAFGVDNSSTPVDVFLTLSLDRGVYFLDMDEVLERVRRTFPTRAHFDINIDVPDDSGRKLFGYAENCPPGRLTIDLNAPPSWLTYR